MIQSPLKVGAVGCGNVVVTRHIPAVMRVEGAQVVAVADPVDARARAAQEAAGLSDSKAFDSLEAEIGSLGKSILKAWTRQHVFLDGDLPVCHLISLKWVRISRTPSEVGSSATYSTMSFTLELPFDGTALCPTSLRNGRSTSESPTPSMLAGDIST